MDRRLGYRLVLASAELPPAIRPGGAFTLHLSIRNEGFAGPMNPRPLALALRAGGQTFRAAIEGIDARALLGGETVDVAAHVLLPSDLEEGPATLSLDLEDPALPGDARYAIRFANEGVWDEAAAVNDLGVLTISDAAEGTAAADRTELRADAL
jgi:hypothetical protein